MYTCAVQGHYISSHVVVDSAVTDHRHVLDTVQAILAVLSMDLAEGPNAVPGALKSAWAHRHLVCNCNHGRTAAQVSEALADAVHDCFHLQDMEGSDHCPVGLTLRLKQPLTPDPATP